MDFSTKGKRLSFNTSSVSDTFKINDKKMSILDKDVTREFISDITRGQVFLLRDNYDPKNNNPKMHPYIILSPASQYDSRKQTKVFMITSLRNGFINGMIPIIAERDQVTYISPYNIYNYYINDISMNYYKGSINGDFIGSDELLKLAFNMYRVINNLVTIDERSTILNDYEQYCNMFNETYCTNHRHAEIYGLNNIEPQIIDDDITEEELPSNPSLISISSKIPDTMGVEWVQDLSDEELLLIQHEVFKHSISNIKESFKGYNSVKSRFFIEQAMKEMNRRGIESSKLKSGIDQINFVIKFECDSLVKNDKCDTPISTLYAELDNYSSKKKLDNPFQNSAQFKRVFTSVFDTFKIAQKPDKATGTKPLSVIGMRLLKAK